MRGHKPLKIEEFNGLWRRGSQDSTPPDHFTDCNNIQYVQSGFKTRDGIEPFLPYSNIVRIYPFNQSLLILDTNANIYHTDRAAPFTPILHVTGMTDFSIQKFANRVYITPVGPTNDFVYVYTYGDAAGARKAAGFGPNSAPTLAIGGAGHVEKGVHIIAVAYETDTGFITNISPGSQITVDGTTSITVSLPIGGATVSARQVVATKAIDPADFTGDLNGYQFFFVTRVDNNTDTSVDIDFYDAELLDDASHLEDLYEEIPNCYTLGLYHNRLVLASFPQGNSGEEIANIYLSDVGEPEAVNQVDNLIALTKDGLGITAVWNYRDILYASKSNKTFAINDNADVPSSWPFTQLDDGVGPTFKDTIAVVMDVGDTLTETVMIGNKAGLYLFDGTYRRPELSWKIEDIWDNIREIHINSNKRLILVVLDDGTMIMGDFKNGLDPENIRWTPWTFDIEIKTVCLLLESGDATLVLGSQQLAS